MRRYLATTLVILILFFSAAASEAARPGSENAGQQVAELGEGFKLLKIRKDRQALAVFDKVLLGEPENPDALWGRAEILRRLRKFGEAEILLNGILKENPAHGPSLVSLSYIKYKDGRLSDALKLANEALEASSLNKESQALAYMMLASINACRAKKGWFLNKIIYGTQIKGYFLKARALVPELPEVHLGLGSFYLLAPAIAGGDLNKALKELQLAVEIAPDFATANVRLAQAYKRKGELAKYDFYIRRARELDPENETLKEDL